MEPFIADMINNFQIPKWLRYTISSAVSSFAVFLGVALAIESPILIGRIFGGLLAFLFLAVAIYLFVKIAKSQSKAIKQ